eukprot:UC4_evm2s815
MSSPGIPTAFLIALLSWNFSSASAAEAPRMRAEDDGKLVFDLASSAGALFSCPGDSTEAYQNGFRDADEKCEQKIAQTEKELAALKDSDKDAVTSTVGVVSTVHAFIIDSSKPCYLGDCRVKVVTKPFGTPIALLKDFPLYRCSFSSQFLDNPLVTESYEISSDGFSIECDIPMAAYPDASGKTLDLTVTLHEGHVSLPYEDGQRSGGKNRFPAPTVTAMARGPVISAEDKIDFFRYNLPEDNTGSYEFMVTDMDTDDSKLDVIVDALPDSYDGLIINVRQNPDKNSTWLMDFSNIDNQNLLGYKTTLTVKATDTVGLSTVHRMMFNFYPKVLTSMMPPGSTVQLVSSWSNKNYDIGGIPAFGNNINNLRPSTMEITITLKKDNSKVYVMTQFVYGAHTTSHQYVDIWRKIQGETNYRSLAQLYAGGKNGWNDVDGLSSWHNSGGESTPYEKPKRPFVLDAPNQQAGTEISYKVYVGLWNGGTITFGSHRSNNNNGRAPEHFVVREVADGDCPGECLPVEQMPVGSNVQTVESWSLLNYDIGSIPQLNSIKPSAAYGNNIWNLRPSEMTIGITTKRDNSAIFVSAQFVIGAHTTSHNYVDIWRKVDGVSGKDSFISLAQLYANDADGLLSWHNSGSTNTPYEQPRSPFVLDNMLNVPKGSRVTYKIYVGLWNGGTITFGSHRSNNNNGRTPEHFIAREVVTENVQGVEPRPISLMPPGTTIQSILYLIL